MADKNVQPVERMLRNPAVLVGVLVATTVPLVLILWLLFPFYKNVLSDPFWFPLIVAFVMLGLIMQLCALCILAERKIAAFTQDRYGPNRVGFWGLFQFIADGVKMLMKEDIIPGKVDKPLFLLAPTLAFIVAMLGFLIIPWGGYVRWPWMDSAAAPVRTQVASLDIGVLYLFAVASLGVYGVVLAGYASNNKYSFFGGMRATAQMISYEIPLGLGLLVLLLVAGTLRPEVIVHEQAHTGVWYVLLHPLAFLLMLISGFAETNRAPFDLAEAEQELVGGYHTEYSAMKFGLFFLGEYAHMITGSALLVALFWGGWAPLPFMNWMPLTPGGQIADTWWNLSWLAMLIKFGIYFAKIAVLIVFYMVIRWTLPRFRFDQLMRVAWQGMVPAGIALLVGTAILTAFNLQRSILASLALNAVVLVGMLIMAARSRRPVTGRQEDLPVVVIGGRH